jgi:hypothetical protein
LEKLTSATEAGSQFGGDSERFDACRCVIFQPASVFAKTNMRRPRTYEKGKWLVEFLVIEHAEKPPEN